MVVQRAMNCSGRDAERIRDIEERSLAAFHRKDSGVMAPEGSLPSVRSIIRYLVGGTIVIVYKENGCIGFWALSSGIQWVESELMGITPEGVHWERAPNYPN